MAADVFISHSSKDLEVAEAICTALERRGASCWISSRDVDAGENFAEAIVDAIAVAKVMLLVFSANANNSGEIKKELVVASHSRTVVIPVRVEDVVPSGAMRYELATRQWIDLFADWEREVDRLARRIQAVVAAKRAGVDAEELEAIPSGTTLEPGKGSAAAVRQDRPAIPGPAADQWGSAVPGRLLAVEAGGVPAAAGGSMAMRLAAPVRRRPLLLVGAAGAFAVACTAAVVLTRQAPGPTASVPVTGRPERGETVGYVAGLDPYGDNYLSLRSGPGTEYAELYRMGENTFVHVVTVAGKWTRVRLAGGQSGWAYSQYLRPGYPP